MRLHRLVLLLITACSFALPLSTARSAATVKLAGEIKVQGSPDRRVVTRAETFVARPEGEPDGAVRTRAYALPANVKQPVQPGDTIPYLMDLDEDGRFGRDIEPGNYLIGLTNTLLDIVEADSKLQLLVNGQTLRVPVKKVLVAESGTTQVSLSITVASADARPPGPFMTEPSAGGAIPASHTGDDWNLGVWAIAALGAGVIAGLLAILLFAFARRQSAVG